MSSYDLLDVEINGVNLRIRPIDWVVDEDSGEEIPVKYESVDPASGQLIWILPEHITMSGKVWGSIDPSTDEQTVYFESDEETLGIEQDQDLISALSDSINVKHEDDPKLDNMAVHRLKPKTKEELKEKDIICPFQDPVKAGELRPVRQ